MSHLHDRVSGLVDGELGGAARSRALAHLRRCADCRAEVRATLEVKRRLGGLAAAEPPADLRAALGTVPSPELVAVPLHEPSHTGRKLLAGAATLSVALLGVAYAVGAPQEQPAATVRPPVQQFAADFADSTGAAALSDPAVGVLDLDGQAMTLLAVGQVALPAALAAVPRGDQPRAIRLLERAAEAGGRLAYTGERRVTVLDGAGASVATVHVQHVPEQGTSLQLAGDVSAAATFVPAPGRTRGTESDSLDVLVDTFDVAVAGSARVAGRPATVISVGRSGLTAATFYVDDATGLLLRRDLYAEGRLVRSTQFTSVRLPVRQFLPHLPPELDPPEATALSMSFAASLNDQGWTCPERLPGGLTLERLRSLEGDIVHATYTDGLSTLAVFEQRGRLDPSGLEGFRRAEVAGRSVHLLSGLPTFVVWASDDTVYTVVSDAPQQMIATVVGALPHQTPADDDPTDRLGTGLQRLLSVVDPAD